MMSRTASAGLACALVLALFALNGEAASCDCGFGRVVSATPSCVCECDATYVQPQCLFHPDDVVPLFAVLNTTKSAFVSESLIQSIASALGVNASSLPTQDLVLYRGTAFDAEEAKKYPNYILVRVGVKGAHLNGLLGNVSTHQSWLASANIVDMYLNPSATNTGDRSLVEATIYDNGQVIVLLGSLYWFIGAIVVCCVLCWCEKCWLDCQCGCLPWNKEKVEEFDNGHAVVAVVASDANEPVKGEELPPPKCCDSEPAQEEKQAEEMNSTQRTNDGSSEPLGSHQPSEVVGDDEGKKQRRYRHSSRRDKQSASQQEPTDV